MGLHVCSQSNYLRKEDGWIVALGKTVITKVKGNRQADREIDIWIDTTGGQRDRDRQTDRQADSQIGRQIDKQADRDIDIRIDTTGRQAGRQLNEQLDEQAGTWSLSCRVTSWREPTSPAAPSRAHSSEAGCSCRSCRLKALGWFLQWSPPNGTNNCNSPAAIIVAVSSNTTSDMSSRFQHYF